MNELENGLIIGGALAFFILSALVVRGVNLCCCCKKKEKYHVPI